MREAIFLRRLYARFLCELYARASRLDAVKRQALEFIVDGSQMTLVSQTMRRIAGDALTRLTLAPLDGTPRYRITAVVEAGSAASVMQAVMNALDKSG
jgi:hypothetical protein